MILLERLFFMKKVKKLYYTREFVVFNTILNRTVPGIVLSETVLSGNPLYLKLAHLKFWVNLWRHMTLPIQKSTIHFKVFTCYPVNGTVSPQFLYGPSKMTNQMASKAVTNGMNFINIDIKAFDQ